MIYKNYNSVSSKVIDHSEKSYFNEKTKKQTKKSIPESFNGKFYKTFRNNYYFRETSSI